MSSEILLASQSSSNGPVSAIFTRKELVGKGAYGGVYKGIHNATGTVVALKVIDLDTPDDDISEIQKEVALLSEMRDANRHNITLYHGCYLNGHELWIAMDFASGGSIRTLMKSGTIEEKYIVLIVREVLVALSFLHRQGIIHRDVKAANILLTQAGKILLCDFGVAAHLQTNNKRSTFIGTPLWMAPEVITDGKLYDTKADIWSLGVALYEIATGNPPYFGMEPLRACALIPRQVPAKFEAGPYSGFMREFLSLCLQMDPAHRLTADELSKSKWIKSASRLPMVILRELIVRYLSWIQTGGQRASLAGMDSLAREDTFDLEEDIWDFDIGASEPKIEPLGDEPVRTLDAQAAISNIRPPKVPVHTSNISRHHPLLRLFDAESNPYANATPTIINLPSGISSMDTVRPMISIPSFEEMDEMADAKTMKFTDLPQDLMSPSTIRPSPFSWASQPRPSSPFMSPLPRSGSPPPESPWGSGFGFETPITATFPDFPPLPPVTSSPSLPSLLPQERPLPSTRRRADTAPSSDYPPLGPGIPSPLPNLSHSTSTSISSFNSMQMSSGSSSSSHTSHPHSPQMAQRPLNGRTRTIEQDTNRPFGDTGANRPFGDAGANRPFGDAGANRPLADASANRPLGESNSNGMFGEGSANRPFRERKGSDLARPLLRIGTSDNTPRPRIASDARPTGMYPKQGLKLQISTIPTISNGGAYDSPQTATPPSTINGRYDSAFDFPTPLARATSTSFPFPFPSVPTAPLAIDQSPPPQPKWPSGPPLRPLDYGKLVTATDVHAELERTIGELSEWLGVVDDGLTRILTGTSS